jgi:hypothetical protein
MKDCGDRRLNPSYIHMSATATEYIEVAKAALLASQRVTTGLVQRSLRLGYSDAESVLATRQDDGFVTTKLDGVRRLAEAYERPETALRASYVRSVFETVRFFWEMWEEGGAGDTRVMNLLKPNLKIGNRGLRKYVLRGCFEAQKMSLAEAAVALADHWHEQGFGASLTSDDYAELGVMCATVTRPFYEASEPSLVLQRSFIRLARYLALRGPNAHTRCFEYFLNGLYNVPIGYGKNGGGWGEHVVPLAYIRSHCVEMIAGGGTFEDAAKDIKRFLTIVDITPEQSALLDRGPASGGLGLRSTMPEFWCPKTGSIYARLELAGIEFAPPN